LLARSQKTGLRRVDAPSRLRRQLLWADEDQRLTVCDACVAELGHGPSRRLRCEEPEAGAAENYDTCADKHCSKFLVHHLHLAALGSAQTEDVRALMAPIVIDAWP
jgi:hypothetical protein